MRAMRPTLDTGAGLNLIRVDQLPANWTSFASKNRRTPKVVDASGNPLPILAAINIIVDSGHVKMVSTFHVVKELAVPAILGTRFINQHVEAIYPRLNKVYWTDPSSPVSVCMPILDTHCVQRQQGKVRLAKRTTLPPFTEVFAAANSDITGLIHVTTNSRLHQGHQVILANGVACTLPAVPFQVRLCNVGATTRYLKKGTVLGSAEMYEGPVIATVDEKPQPPQDKPAPSVDSVDLADAPKHLHKRIRRMLEQHQVMWSGKLGTIHATVHRIETDDKVIPIHQAPYRTGLRKREIITDCINAMLKQEVIRPSHSDWSSPVVVVPKKNGKPRFCIDYRRLNAVTKKDTYPIPRMDDCLDSLGEAQFFSTLDCTAGYWQVPLRKEDQEKTAFACHDGLFEWVVMPFGLTNAPATFQRALDIILSGLKWQICLVYLDDVIVFSKSAEEHVRHLDVVLTRLRKAGVTLNLEKCAFFKKEVEYLGHLVCPGQLKVHNKNTEALKRATFPKTKTHMKSFLGACNVYRRFVKDFAKRARPLTELTKNDVGPDLPEPTAEQLAAFEDLKQALVTPPVLTIPHPTRRFVVDVDACADQLGCALLQEQEDGQLQPVGYYSRTLKPAEQNYCTTERECLGLVWGVLTLRHFLDGNKFTVRTDHQALRWIYNTTDPSSRLMRWRLRLAEFTFDVLYKPGASHHAPDFLSRTRTGALDDSDLDDEIPCLALAETARSLQRGRYTHAVRLTPVAFEDLVADQATDALCKVIRKKMAAGKAPNFSVKDGALYREGLDGDQLVVPHKHRARLLHLAHFPTTEGHPGSNRMYYSMRRRFYWPSMATDAYGVVTRCAACAQSRLALRRHTAPMRLFPATEPLTEVNVDILGPLPVSLTRNKYVLAFTDRFSKVVRCVALKKVTAVTVASALVEVWVASYGPPDVLLSDQGSQFMSKFFIAVCRTLGIETRESTPYHPQTNGQVERYNRTIIKQLRHYVADNPQRWDELLPILTYAYNTQPHRSTGVAPFELVIPRRIPNLTVHSPPPGVSIQAHGTTKDGSPLSVKRSFMARLRKTIPKVAEALRKTQQRYKKTYDKNLATRNKDVKIGDYVYLKAHQREHKLSSPTNGPFLVVDLDDKTFVVQVGDEESRVSWDQATPAPRPDAAGEADATPHALLKDKVNLSDRPSVMDDYLIDKLVGYRCVDGEHQAKVRWWGYQSNDDVWTPLGDLPKHLVLRYLRNQNKQVPGYEWSPTKMTLRSQSQGLPHPDARVNAVTPSVRWVPTIIAFHQSPDGHVQARLIWTHPRGQVGEVIPLYYLRSTFPTNFPRNIPERADWTAPRAIVDRLEKLHGPHTIDLFATRANKRFERFGSKECEPGAEWRDSMSHDWTPHNAWANPPTSLLPEIAERLASGPPLALTLLAPRWEAQEWFSIFMNRCFEYEELPLECFPRSPASPDLWVAEHPPVWTTIVFRFERNHAGE